MIIRERLDLFGPSRDCHIYPRHSATRTGSEDKGDKTLFKFEQKLPIASYLIALAVGDIVSREIGPRSRVWSEPSMVDAGAFEFAETEAFLKAGEELVTPYEWGVYDLLLLPPSFPYGFELTNPSCSSAHG